jgi:hypothetical protein
MEHCFRKERRGKGGGMYLDCLETRDETKLCICISSFLCNGRCSGVGREMYMKGSCLPELVTPTWFGFGLERNGKREKGYEMMGEDRTVTLATCLLYLMSGYDE